MPSSVVAPSDWVVVESGSAEYSKGDIIVPHLQHAGKVTLDNTEYLFIQAENILAKVIFDANPS